MMRRLAEDASHIFLACGATDFRFSELVSIVSMQFRLDHFQGTSVRRHLLKRLPINLIGMRYRIALQNLSGSAVYDFAPFPIAGNSEFMNGFHARLLQCAYIAFIFNLFHCLMARRIKRTIFRIFYFDDTSDFF